MEIFLVGNPNSGKTSIFNELTGLNHKVGNFPGVTVDRKSGICHLDKNTKAEVIDLPGTYSLYPKSIDEAVAVNSIINEISESERENKRLVIVMDASNLKRSLYYCSQLLELKYKTIIALTLNDVAKNQDKNINVDFLSKFLGVPIITVNPKTGEGIDNLKSNIIDLDFAKFVPQFFNIKDDDLIFVNESLKKNNIDLLDSDYLNLHRLQQQSIQGNAYELNKEKLNIILAKEVKERYEIIDEIISKVERKSDELSITNKISITEKLDKVLLHPFWGILILLAVLVIVFQSVFLLASYPMDWIDGLFGNLTEYLSTNLPNAWWSDLLINGVVAGLGGVVIFVPQIAILFFLISILEDSGYMARISFLMDRLFQGAGLSGKSVMPMISGMACAIPAVMAARTIENRKQRMLTILVTPFMSCTARLPVYAILISMFVPEIFYFGFIGLQGLVLMFMYLLGFVTALLASKVLSLLLYKKDNSFFIQELPVYQQPRWKNAFYNLFEKSKVFLLNAGKIILIISIGLWFLSSYGPSERRDVIEKDFEQIAIQQNEELTPIQETEKNSLLLENSYIGILGKSIEPVIAPMGYDWKIGIAILTSFAAREVFVGTMSTIYAIEDEEDTSTLKERMFAAKRSDGTPVYTFATGMSLMIFYAFAMQCMATLAAVKREAGGWKMAIFQWFMMTGLAYLSATIVYQILK